MHKKRFIAYFVLEAQTTEFFIKDNKMFVVFKLKFLFLLQNITAIDNLGTNRPTGKLSFSLLLITC